MRKAGIPALISDFPEGGRKLKLFWGIPWGMEQRQGSAFRLNITGIA